MGMKVSVEQALKYTKIREKYAFSYQKRTNAYMSSISVIYTTLSSALLLFAYKADLGILYEKLLLIISIFLSITIVFSTLLFKYYFSKAPLETINSKKAEDFYKESIVSLEPKESTQKALTKLPGITVILILLQLITSLLFAFARIF